VPAVPLDRLYGDELRHWFAEHGVTMRLNAGVKSVEIEGGRVTGVTLRDGERVASDWCVVAVPFERIGALLPEAFAGRETLLKQVAGLTHSPITSVHLWFNRPVTDLPHAVLVGCLGQWVFCRGEATAGEWYVQVVVSAARDLKPLGHDEIERQIVDELRRVFPDAAGARLLRTRVVTEHAATFSAVPGVDRFRPGPRTAVPNLVLAGDWTATDWPATMEGAVRSGYAAAEVVTGECVVRPDLGA
jgi:squalene-associated FAD-dependent desaturase